MSASTVLLAAELLAKTHHSKYDPSHDFHHVHGVRSVALSIVHSLPPPAHPDFLVVELAALFHDLLDRKYLPEGMKNVSAREHLRAWWEENDAAGVLREERRRLIEKGMENVSSSKEIKRIAEGRQTAWHEECLELHCVQDADKLDAIGAFGILRLAAYSVVDPRALYIPESTSSSNTLSSPSPDSALKYLKDQLLALERLMRTPKGKDLARRRTQYLESFAEEVEKEWEEAAVGEALSGVERR